jgi:hypothetical protein
MQLEIIALKSTTAILRDLEFLQAILTQKRSRLKHIALGDIGSKYFFSPTRSKHKQEDMTEIMLDSGEINTDPKLILAEVHRFYCSLYKPDPVDTEQKQSTIAELLQYTVNTITSSQLLSIERTPDEEELTKIVKSFAHNKAPGSDGLTIEVVKECWPFLKVDILE